MRAAIAMSAMRATMSVLLLAVAACTPALPAARGPAPSPAEQERARCGAARERFRAELLAAADNCFTDEGCVAFDTCHAVIRGSEPALLAAQRQSQEACTAAGAKRVEVECAARPPRCVARRCVRF